MIGLARSTLRLLALIAIFIVGLSGMARAEESDRPLSAGELAQIVAPIALYPDTLLTQVLMASTYPLEVVAAARWSRQNPNVTGAALEAAMQRQNWDSSVKALTALPQILQMMSDKLDWMQQLGDAFLAQPDELFDAVQQLRARAEAAGHLKSTDEQRVARVQRPASVTVVPGTPAPPQTVIVIESVLPETYFVPIYNPSVVFGAWPFPAYQPFFWHPPGWVATNAFAFATGVFVGSAIWGNVNWWNRSVNINVNRYNSFNRTRVVNNNWTHNPQHRRGVPYRNANVSKRFDQNRGAARQKAADRVAQGKGIGGGMQGGAGYGMGGMAGAGGMKGGPGYGIGGMAGTGGMKGSAGYGMKGTGGGMAGAGGMKGGPGYGMKGAAGGGMKGAGGMKGSSDYGMGGGMAGAGGMKGGPGYGMKGAGGGGMKGTGGGGMKGPGGGGMGGGSPGGGMAGGLPGGGMAGGGMAGGGMAGGGMAGGGMAGGGMAGGGMRR